MYKGDDQFCQFYVDIFLGQQCHLSLDRLNFLSETGKVRYCYTDKRTSS